MFGPPCQIHNRDETQQNKIEASGNSEEHWDPDANRDLFLLVLQLVAYTSDQEHGKQGQQSDFHSSKSQ